MNLRDYLLIIRRRRWIGIIVLVASIATAATLTTLANPVYESKASVFVGPQSIVGDGGSNISGVSNVLDVAQRLTKTFARMITSVPVANKAVADGRLRVSPGYLIQHITVTPIQDTTLIELTVHDPDPVQAANMANATGAAFVDIAEALTTPRNDPSAGPAVPVTLFEEAAIPLSPVSPNPSRNLALAAVLGILVGVGLMFAAEYLDVAVRGPDDIERLVGLPVLALIPKISRDDIAPRRAARPAKAATARTPRTRVS